MRWIVASTPFVAIVVNLNADVVGGSISGSWP